MPKFSDLSKKRLLECHAEIIFVLNRVIHYIDFSIECGYRGKKAQDKAFKDGFSKVKYPRSKHNAFPSLAVDIKPYLDGKTPAHDDYLYLAGHVMMMARIMLLEGRVKHAWRWGNDWDMDDMASDETFRDPGHFEIK